MLERYGRLRVESASKPSVQGSCNGNTFLTLTPYSSLPFRVYIFLSRLPLHMQSLNYSGATQTREATVFFLDMFRNLIGYFLNKCLATSRFPAGR